jgi:hypothetical protein
LYVAVVVTSGLRPVCQQVFLSTGFSNKKLSGIRSSRTGGLLDPGRSRGRDGNTPDGIARTDLYGGRLAIAVPTVTGTMLPPEGRGIHGSDVLRGMGGNGDGGNGDGLICAIFF